MFGRFRCRIGFAFGIAWLAGATHAATWCDRVVDGPAADAPPLIALSAAHAGVRQFGSVGTWQRVDLALAHALAQTQAPDYRLPRAALDRYAAEIGNGQTCPVDASRAVLPKARIRMAGVVAFVRPGTGTLSLPTAAQAVVLDLRGLPNAAGLRGALDAAASLALATPVNRGRRQQLVNYGYSDQYAGGTLYYQSLTGRPPERIPGAGARDLALAVITEPRMAPESVALAAALRLANRAWLVGSDLDLAVAESTFLPVSADSGLQYHVADLFDPVTLGRWPDAVAADIPISKLGSFQWSLVALGAPPALATTPAARARLVAATGRSAVQPATLGPGEARAGLVIAHGALRQFFPYFDVVGDTIDRQLFDALSLVEEEVAASGGGPVDRFLYMRTLGYFSAALADAHVYLNDYYSRFYGYLPLVCEQIDGRPVVRRSDVPGLVPGDTLTSIDGIAADAWFAYYASVDSAPTPGGLFQKVVGDWLTYSLGAPARSFGVVSADGKARTVVAAAVPFSTPDTLGFAPSERASGFLGDLGAPDVYYFNMDESVTTSTAGAAAAIAAAQGARGMIVDMRGYPAASNYAVASALIPSQFVSPRFQVRVAFGGDPGDEAIDTQQLTLTPSGAPRYDGPLVLVVGNATLSAAENFATMLVDARRPLHVVGRPSSGTNGNLTGLQLPGGFAFSFTGMRVTHADGSRYHGIGIVPDIEVPLSAADFAAGRDPELEAAIRALR